MQDDIDNILGEIAAKDSQVLCREVLSIGDTMDVLRSKWTVEILTAILCGNTRFKDILTAIHGLSDKVLTERLRQMVDCCVILAAGGCGGSRWATGRGAWCSSG